MKVIALRKKTVLYIIILIIVTVLAVGAYFALSRWVDTRNSLVPEDVSYDDNGRIAVNNQWYIAKSNLDSILLIGIDKSDDESLQIEDKYRNNRLNDFILLVVIDNEAKTYTGIQINRDTMVDVRAINDRNEEIGTVFGQIALAHTYGTGGKESCMNVVKTVSNFLYGVDIRHYASFTMEAVPVLNDMVGGVTVTCLDDFTYAYPEMTNGATVTLKGEQALTYIRARYQMTEPTNIARMERQRQYLTAFHEKLSNADLDVNEDFISKTLTTLSDEVVTDCTINQLQRLYEKASTYEFKGILTPDGEAKVGVKFMEFTVNNDDLRQIIADVYYTPIEE